MIDLAARCIQCREWLRNRTSLRLDSHDTGLNSRPIYIDEAISPPRATRDSHALILDRDGRAAAQGDQMNASLGQDSNSLPIGREKW